MTDNTNAKMLAMQKEHGPLLEVKELAIDFTTDTGKPVHAVRDANFTVYPGQWVAIVGESGSGKSTSAMAVLGLLPGTGHVVNGSIKLEMCIRDRPWSMPCFSSRTCFPSVRKCRIV